VTPSQSQRRGVARSTTISQPGAVATRMPQQAANVRPARVIGTCASDHPSTERLISPSGTSHVVRATGRQGQIRSIPAARLRRPAASSQDCARVSPVRPRGTPRLPSRPAPRSIVIIRMPRGNSRYECEARGTRKSRFDWVFRPCWGSCSHVLMCNLRANSVYSAGFGGLLGTAELALYRRGGLDRLYIQL